MSPWIVVALCLILANFFFQLIKEQDWGAAFERSWFQVMAIITVYLSRPWEGW